LRKALFVIFILCVVFYISSSIALSLTYVNTKYEALPYPDNYKAYLKDGYTFTQQKNTIDAMRCFNRAQQLAEEKNDAQQMGAMAYYYLAAGAPDKAFNAYRRGNQLALQWASTHRDYAMDSLKYLINLYQNYLVKFPQHSASQTLAKEAKQAAVDLETLQKTSHQQPADLQCTGKWLAGCKEGTGTEYGYFNLKINAADRRVYDGNIESRVFKSNYRVSGTIDAGGEMLVHGHGEGGVVTMTGKLKIMEQAKNKYVGHGTFHLQRSTPAQGISCTSYEGTWETDTDGY
jgi:tetratricopeptide (TPR) repeat protein